ncbi:MAG: SPOR domain-containing protein [Gemmatimonadaceae bacterium]
MPLTRILLLGLAAAVACGNPMRSVGTATGGTGADAVLVRMPAGGGYATAYRSGSDSLLWRARDATPPIAAIIGFDDFQGLVSAQDQAGRVVAVHLRLGSVEMLGEERVRGEVVAEGAAVFGLDVQGRVLRLTPVATWSWQPPPGVTRLLPNPDGSLILLTVLPGGTTARRMIPPETRIVDSVSIPAVRHAVQTMAGDRLWFVTDSGLLSLRSRDLVPVLELPLRDSVVALVTTPSGDRVFLATDRASLQILDRYAERIRGEIRLPSPAAALRMDPDGRYLLVRARGVDSVYVVSIGTSRVVNALLSVWRDDLPLVTPDGRLVVVDGPDAVIVDAESGRERLRYPRGAADVWSLVRWNGFRPRAAGLDRPVEFEDFVADSVAADSALAALLAARYGDISALARPTPIPPTPRAPQAPQARQPVGAPVTPVPPPPEVARRAEPTARGTWTVSFATLLSEDRARSLADSIRYANRNARVVLGNRDGVTVWRVLLGPFDTRQEAERAGMASRRSYWVFEGAP